MSGRIASLGRPVFVVSIVAAALAIAGAVRYPLGSVAVNTIRPSDNTTRPAPIINPPQVLGTYTQKPSASLPKLALSFDDGPNPMTTPLILNTLESQHVHASFFVVGSRVAGNESILRREYRDGDDIGNHSWSHPNFSTLNQTQITSQINQTERAIAAAGVPAPFMFRPPYGVLGSNFPKHLPMAIVLWNIDPKDWYDHDPTALQQAIVSQARPGGIIDLHGIYGATTQAIGPAIAQLKQHYQLVTVSQLLGISPGDTGKYYGFR